MCLAIGRRLHRVDGHDLKKMIMLIMLLPYHEIYILFYNSENCFVDSLYHLASCVKGTFDSETKSLFWSRLLVTMHCNAKRCQKIAFFQTICVSRVSLGGRCLKAKVGKIELGPESKDFPREFYSFSGLEKLISIHQRDLNKPIYTSSPFSR